MQTLTITPKDLPVVVNYIYPDLISNVDFGAVKFSDSEEIFLEWLTDKYVEPEMSVLESTLLIAQQVKAQAEAEAAAKKAAAEAKLAALGLTTNDLKALGL
jgi:hypothetical protein